jgi:hypothetical protein
LGDQQAVERIPRWSGSEHVLKVWFRCIGKTWKVLAVTCSATEFSARHIDSRCSAGRDELYRDLPTASRAEIHRVELSLIIQRARDES